MAAEVVCGQKSGDYVCSDCGEVFKSEELKDLRDVKKAVDVDLLRNQKPQNK